jgi:hypothetical protein
MNIIKRFRNELIILLALLFTLSAFFYKVSAKNSVAEKKAEVQKSVSEISRVAELKKLWASKQIGKDAKALKTIVAKKKVKLFKKTSEKVTVKYSGLNIKELNKITKKIMNRAFQITKLKVVHSGNESYAMELTCSW